MQGLPALVLGTGVTALAVLRELGRAGITTWHLAPREDLASRSRWSQPVPGGGTASPPALEAFLAQAPIAQAVLFPCSDAWAEAVADLSDDLTSRFRPTGPPRAVLQRLVDKAAFAETLREVGLPHPRTELLRGPADLAALPDALLVGAFLKPVDSHAFNRAFGKKAVWLEDRAQAARVLEEAERHGLQLVLQEYVPSRPEDRILLDGFVDRHGTIRACYGRRRLRMYPHDFGNSTLTEVIPLDEVRVPYAHLCRLIEAIGFRGIFDAEFVHDRRTGEHRLIEINARPFWQVALGPTVGAPLCTMAWQDAMGEDVPTVTRCGAGARWAYEPFDLRAFLGGLRRRRLRGGLPPLAWRGARALFAADDPGPAIGEAKRYLRRALGREEATPQREEAPRRTWRRAVVGE